MKIRLVALLAAVAALAFGLTACDPAAQVLAHGGTGQIRVSTEPGALVGLYDSAGRLVPTLELPEQGDPVPVNFRKTDANGSLVMRYVPVGTGYTVRRVDNATTKPSDPVNVTGLLSQPNQSLYMDQKLNIGYGYMTMRDGTLLSYMVHLPGPVDKGPYPTLVEYSGYDPSRPGDFSGTTASTRIASYLGYATVGVNIRGTGCSGGSFQMWEDAQATDGYDVVETVAAQPWVANHKVGLVGLSYPGNGALYAAATQPPHLAAIAVGGTYDDGFRDLLRPNGIVNNGFAKEWVEGRYSESVNGQDWTHQQIDGGDAVCAYNQKLRSQNVDLSKRIDTDPYYPTTLNLGDSFAPATFVNRIKVPVFLVAAWQDEQVGGHVPTMFPNFTGTSKKHFILTNGGHAEMFAVPDIIQRWDEFLDLYVKKQVPEAGFLKSIAPYIGQQVLGSPDQLTTLDFPADRFTGKTYAQALAAYEAEPQVHVEFENGAGVGKDPGLPQAAFTKDFSQYPIPGTTATRWYMGPGGTLTGAAPTAADGSPGSFDSYVSDPSARPRTSTTGGGDWAQFPPYNWADPVAGKSLTYLSPAMTSDTTMIGSASVDLYLRSSAPDTDLQVTLTEVRPDGQEEYVQSGWLRASARKLDPTRSTVLQPLPSMLEQDAAPLPAGQFTQARVEIYPFAHVFRAGSKFRLIVTAPGGDRMAWAFDTLPGTQANDIAHSAGLPSSVALPIVPGVSIPTGLPTCPGPRGQPCRTYHGPTS